MNKLTDLEKLLFAKRSIEANGCWIWKGNRILGYGSIWIERKRYGIHRISAFHFKLKDCNGNLFTLDSKLEVLHQCDNHSCFNPEHLFIGTQADNIKDRDKKKRIFADSNLLALTKEDVLKIKELYFKDKLTQEEIASKYGLKQPHISGIVNDNYIFSWMEN